LAEGSINRLTEKGFGFIRMPDGSDVFFHSTALEGVVFEQLHIGQRVEFTKGEGPRGPRAEAIRLV
jgi:cold shock protein